MSYANTFNILNTVMRAANRRDKIILPPFNKIVTVPHGYYSPKVGDNNIDEDNEDSFFLSEVEYVRRDGVNFQVEVVGSYSKLLSIFKISKSELNKAELHVLIRNITLGAWNVIGTRVCEDPQAISQRGDFEVRGEHYASDVFAGIYSVLYHITYDVIAKNRCEYSQDIEFVKRNINNLDVYWGEGNPNRERVAIHIGGAVDKFLSEFVQPFVNVETSKVGQAHVNENMSSILSQYEALKNLISCVAGNQVSEDRYFTILSDYLEHAIGQEDIFRDLVKMIRMENMDKNPNGQIDYGLLRDRLTIDGTPLEEYTKGLIIRSLNYTETNLQSVTDRKRTLSNLNMPIFNIEVIMRGVEEAMDNVINVLETNYNLSLEDLNKLDITKVTTSRYTSYTTRYKAGKYDERRSRAIVELASRFMGYNLQLNGKVKGLVDITQTVAEDGQSAEFNLTVHYFRKINLTLRKLKSGVITDLVLKVEIPNLEQGNLTKELTWDKTGTR